MDGANHGRKRPFSFLFGVAASGAKDEIRRAQWRARL
jgi:hypothetical protein